MTLVLDARTVNPHYPGIGRYTFELARALAALAELTLIVNPLQAQAEMDLWALPARRVAVPHSPRALAQQWVVPARLRRLKATVYHSPYYAMPYAPGAPAVVTAHDLIPLLEPEGFSAGQRLAYYSLHCLAFHAAAQVVTPSEAARAAFLARFRLKPEAVTAVPHGLSREFQPPSAARIAAVQQAYHLPAAYLLYLGSSKPHKNLVTLVRAMGHLPETAPPLIVAGPDDLRFPQARRAAAGLGERVRFLGRVADADLPALYGGATLYVHPARMEGFGFPVLEALGCGAPVACADIPALRELAHDAAVYFDPREPAAMARVIAEALEDPAGRQARRERGLQRAQAYTWERAAARTLAIYAAAAR